MNNQRKHALVTGATSGLGYEAAAQLADAGYGKVTITGRTAQRAEEARARLTEQTGRDVFEAVTVDLGRPDSVADAAQMMAARGTPIDFLLLNAGMVSGNELGKTADGIEIMTASSLVGHHQLTMKLLADSMLTDAARIVIAGSEAARGDVPTFKPVDLPSFASEHYAGDLATAAEKLMRWDVPLKFKPSTGYATTKLFVSYWGAELARRLPQGMTVNTVSPGSAPDTQAVRNTNFFMKRIMVPMFKLMPGKAAPVSTAAARYVEASEYGDDVSGEFFASAPKKMIGPLHRVEFAHVHDRASQEAAWAALVRVAGGVDYPVAA